jgi:Zn-dependent M28 family amino/carboxypeptidase
MSKQIQNCLIGNIFLFPWFDAWSRIFRFRSKHFAPKLLVGIGVGMAIKEEEVPVVPPTSCASSHGGGSSRPATIV